MQAVAEEIHKQARRRFLRRKVDIRGLDETWEIDLVDVSKYSKVNKGYKFLLTIIDIFSKYGWIVALKNKTGVEVAKAMESVLKQGRAPNKIHCDRGREFYNNNFESLMKKYKIHLYSTYSNIKASICERFNRTIKEKMWKKFSLRGDYKWYDILDELVETYNSTKHRTIQMEPSNVTKENSEILRKRYDANFQMLNKKPQKIKFKIGDKVRISKYKHIFEKGYSPNWTTEIFTVSRVKNTFPVTYELKDYQNNPIKGCFYKEELQKTKHPDIYLIEKILKRRGDRILVKWLGFSNEHNSWIHKDNQK